MSRIARRPYFHLDKGSLEVTIVHGKIMPRTESRWRFCSRDFNAIKQKWNEVLGDKIEQQTVRKESAEAMANHFVQMRQKGLTENDCKNPPGTPATDPGSYMS